MIHVLRATIKGTSYLTVTGEMKVQARNGVQEIVVLDKNLEAVTKISLGNFPVKALEISIPEIERGRLPLSVHGIKRSVIPFEENHSISPLPMDLDPTSDDVPYLAEKVQQEVNKTSHSRPGKNESINRQKVKRNEIAACAVIFSVLFIGTIKSTFIVQEVPIVGQGLMKVFTGLAAFFAFMALIEVFKLSRQQKIVKDSKYAFYFSKN